MKKIIFISLLLVASFYLNAQGPSVTGVQSPNAASLGTFGSIPVNYFTGTPDISIPMYTMKSGSITLPISLRYHPANVKPNDHPGWVGLGWNLQCFGVITRAQHGKPDEYSLVDPAGYDKSYYPEGANQLNVSDWDSKTKLSEHFIEQDINYNVFADEFYFNFLDYSGKFVWTANGWKVVSDKNIKVEIPSTNEDAFVDNLGDVSGCDLDQMSVNITINSEQSRMFKEFTLTTDDGTKYVFGGESAIEYTTSYGVYIGEGELVASAWYLKKIIDITGNTIEFNYHRSFPICKLAYSNEFWLISYYGYLSGTYTEGDNTIDTRKHGGSAIFPVYLSEIVGKNDVVSCTTSISQELRYPDYYLKHNDETISPSDPAFDYSFNLYWLCNVDPNYLKWEQLDNIFIKNKNDGSIVRTFKFNYDPNTTQRLTLNSLDEIGTGNSVPQTYSFTYNNIAALPGYGGDSTDHWGYYNAHSVQFKSNTSVNYLSLGPKRANDNLTTYNGITFPVVSTGLLNRITYPTKGYTEFDWEANYFYRIVSNSRQTLDNDDGHPTGGSRIKEIRSYTESGATPVVKKYYYVNNYSGGDPTGYNSSGILNGSPEYFYEMPSDRKTLLNLYTIDDFNYGSANPLTSYSYNAFGSHIGYSEVIELNADGSYSKYKYTNFGLDEYGEPHYDKPAVVIGWNANEDKYAPASQVENERGKPTSISKYNTANQLVEKTNFYYDNSSSRFDKYIKMIDLNSVIAFIENPTPFTQKLIDKNESLHTDCFAFAAAYKNYTYRYNLTSKSTTIYDENGLNPVTTVENYTYNNYDLIQSVTKPNSDGSNTIIRYKYPTDFTHSTNRYFTSVMQEKYMLNNIIEQQEWIDSKLVSDRYNQYINYGTNYVPLLSYIFELETTSPLTIANFLDEYGNYTSGTLGKKITFYYNQSYKLISEQKLNNIRTSYIWGYNNSLPIAKVVNAARNQIAYASFEDGIPTDWTISGGGFSAYSGSNTGTMVYSGGSSTSFQTPSLSAGTYIVSYWAKGNSSYAGATVTVNGANAINPDDVTGGRYKVQVTLSNDGKITIAPPYIYIDDIRIYPVGAQMATYTYDPLIGVTSMTDENNVTTYYEYDGFGRLLRAKDQDGNVLKQYDYHYAEE